MRLAMGESEVCKKELLNLLAVGDTYALRLHFPESGLTPGQVSTKLTISEPCNITADRRGQGLREIENTDNFRRRQKHDFLELAWSWCIIYVQFLGIQFALKRLWPMAMVLHGVRGWSQSGDVLLWRLQQILTKLFWFLISRARLSSYLNHKLTNPSLISISLRPPSSWGPPFLSHSTFPPEPPDTSPWPSEVRRCSWRRLFTSEISSRLSSTETSRWSPCAGRWTGPASIFEWTASSSPAQNCALPTATVAPWRCKEAFLSMETCTFATAVLVVVDAWAESGATSRTVRHWLLRYG